MQTCTCFPHSFPTRWIRNLGAVLTGVGLLLHHVSVTFATDDSPSFGDVVQQHFSHWSRNEKQLSATRVNALLADPKIKGPEAAAIAAIHCYQRKLKSSAHPITAEFLTEPRKEDANARRDQPAAGANLNLNYQGFLKHINTAPRKLFAVDKPALQGIKQGHLGDCYFVSAVGAAVHQNPAHVRSLFHPHADGACDVVFPNGHKAHVPPLTDAQIALGSSAGEQGLWLNVLEVAAGIVEEEHSRGMKEPALDKLGEGGDSVFTIQLLTGHKAIKELIRPHVNGHRQRPQGAEASRIAKKTGEELRETLSRGHLACCGIGDWQVPAGMASDHQYAILGYESGRVHLWNPWGGDYHFEPKSPAGLQNGYPTEHGQFTMPLDEFVAVFGGVNLETAQPAPR